MEIFLVITLFFLFFTIMVQIYSRFYYLPKANKIAKLVAEKKCGEAIKLGESIKKLNSAERLNLIGAYFASGNTDRAKMLVKDLKPNFFYPKMLKEQIEQWKERLS